jgi:hypothetical protein
VRTASAIEQERHALKALRGDFRNAGSSVDAAWRAVWRAVRA